MYSIFHFWKHLALNKDALSRIGKLDEFVFDASMLSCKNKGVFPDLAIKLNKDRSMFTGGELIELKDSRVYNVSSFNSTVPTGKKNIHKIISSENSTTFLQMKDAGDDVFSLKERDVYYLVRGRKAGHQKICLVHGSFFETLEVKELIRRSFAQILEEKIEGQDITDEVKERLESIFSEQEDFSKVRNVDKASVKLRFRVMTEVKPQGNILNPKQYPEIVDDSLNFVTPYHSKEEKEQIIRRMEIVMGKNKMRKFRVFSLKHPLNGWFIVFRTTI